MSSEAVFRRELYKTLKEEEGTFFYRIQDSPGTGQKPCDIFVLKNGLLYGFELKFSKKLGRFNSSSHVKPHQLESLKDIEKCGGTGVFIVNYRFSPTEKQKEKYDLKNNRYNFVFCMSPDDLRDIETDEIVDMAKNGQDYPFGINKVKGGWEIKWM